MEWFETYNDWKAKGVYWHQGKWDIQLTINGQRKYIGRYQDKTLANFIVCGIRFLEVGLKNPSFQIPLTSPFRWSIPLRNSYGYTIEFASVSEMDFEYLNQFNWYKKDYAVRNEKEKHISLHRIVAERAGLDTSNEIDHIDRNKMNNCRDNLRSATNRQQGNNKSKYCNNASGYTGVYWKKQRNKWYVKIKSKCKNIHGGYFTDITKAAMAAASLKLLYQPQLTILPARDLPSVCTETLTLSLYAKSQISFDKPQP